MQRGSRPPHQHGSVLYKRKIAPTENESPLVKRPPTDELTSRISMNAESDYIEEEVIGPTKPRASFSLYSPAKEANYSNLNHSHSSASTDLYKELKKFWNDGNPDVIKLGKAKLSYEENIGPGEKHVERLINELVRTRRFDLASVGSFSKHQVSDPELIRAFFEGSAILQSLALRLAMSALEKAEKADPGVSHRPFSSFPFKYPKLTNLVTINTANVRKAFWIDVGADFRHLNLTALMESWRPLKGDVPTGLKACYRKIFSEITVNPQQIKVYAIRLSNKGRRFAGIKDLPQGVIDVMIGYTLAILGLDHSELENADESSPLPITSFVKGLGSTDEDRFETFFHLAGERRNVLQRAPRLLQEALSDIRQSTMEIENLEDGSCTVNFKNNKRKSMQRPQETSQ